MKRVIALLCALSMLFMQLPLNAMEETMKGISIGIESSIVDKEIDPVSAISGQYSFTVQVPYEMYAGESISVGLSNTISDVQLSQILVNIGYKVSDQFQPYVLMGDSGLKFNQQLNLNAAIQESYYDYSFSDAVSLNLVNGKVSSKMNENQTFGFGVKGIAATFAKGINLVYDIRKMAVQVDTETYTNYILPDYINFPVNSITDLEYSEFNVIVGLSKEFSLAKKDAEGIAISRKYFQSVTPSIGYKYTDVALNVKTDTTVVLYQDEYIDERINVKTEQNYKSNLNSLLLSVGVKISDNWSANVNGVIGDEQGVGAKVQYTF